MVRRKHIILTAIAALTLVAQIPAAQAQGFFNFFGGGYERPAPRMAPMPYASEYDPQRGQQYYDQRSSDPFGFERRSVPRRAAPSDAVASGGSQSFCVRTCDGRYFPINASDRKSKAASCNSFCPASKTEVYHGSTIDNAASDSGKAYTALPNAFKFRNELVAGCTCNGKDQLGLAQVKIEDDPTLRRGDIVAGADGLMVSRGTEKRGASLNMTPAPRAIRAQFERLPVLARQ